MAAKTTVATPDPGVNAPPTSKKKVAQAVMASRVATSKKQPKATKSATTTAAQPPTPKQQARSTTQLDDYVHANGNMSVARRMHVVVPALERLGYTPAQAKQIALDAPLNASSYDQEAVVTALKYAYSISEVGQMQQGGQPAATVAGAMTPNPIDMPPAAKAALDSAQFREKPVTSATRLLGTKAGSKLQKAITPLQAKLDRWADKPVPGGLAGLFLINLLFLGFVVPANAQGYTRFQLLWLTLNNQTSLPEMKEEVGIPNSPIVQGVMDIAQGIGIAADALGGIAGAVSGIADIPNTITGAVESPAFGIAKGIAGFPWNLAGGLINAPVIGGLIQGKGPFGLAYTVPPTNTGANPPPVTPSNVPPTGGPPIVSL